MNRLNISLLVVGALIFASCTTNFTIEDTIQVGHTKTPKPLVGSVEGELMIQLAATAIETIEGLAKAKSLESGRSGLSALDSVLTAIGAYRFERVFPVDKRHEARTRQANLHAWYMIRFSTVVELQKAYDVLSTLPEVELIQYSPIIQRGYQPRKITVLSDQARQSHTDRKERTATFNDPLLSQQWGLVNTGDNTLVTPSISGADVGCREAWQTATGDNSIIVAVLDEGVMYDHEDLAANMWRNTAETFYGKEDTDGNGYAGDYYGYNFVLDNGVITYHDVNDTGHGTHVAGVIAAVNNNGVGIAGIAGGNGSGNGVKIMSCQIFAGNYGVSLYNEARAIKYAADNGAVILQCSWGYNSSLSNSLNYYPGPATDREWISTYPLEKAALDYFIHNAGSPNGVIQGGLAIFAAGNEAAGQAAYPSAYGDYISVAATAADGTPSSYTNYGTLVNMAAPGGDAFYHKAESGSILSTIPVNGKSGYGYMDGTSMACPAVSGVAALGLSYAVEQRRHFKASEFRQLMYRSCTPIESYFTDTKYYWDMFPHYGEVSKIAMSPTTYRNKMGYGLLNAATLLSKISGAGQPMRIPNSYIAVGNTTVVDVGRIFKNGEQLTYTCTVSDSTVATALVSGTTLTIVGLKVGVTQATVKVSNGETQTFTITVRNSAGNNGWL